MQIRWKYIFGVLLLITALIWIAVVSSPDSNLHLVACDVGQGDAILAIYGNIQILTDGGPDNKVLDCLSTYMPFYDREIELVVLTHPQADHYAGLIEVFRRYKVDTFLANSVDASTQGYEVLKKEVGGSGAKIINPTSGMVIRVGLIQLDIIHPADELLTDKLITVESSNEKGVLGVFTTKRDLNDFSIVAILSLRDFDALLTGDIGPPLVNEIAEELALRPKAEWEYLKVPHHGSKNGLTSELLDAVSPQIAVISVGKNNRYGHPHEETLKLLSDPPAGGDIKILRTDLPSQADEEGDIKIVTNGKKWWVGD